MGHGLVSAAEAVVGAKRDLHVAVRGSDIACAFLSSPLGDFRPASAVIRSPSYVRDDKSLRIFRLFYMFLEQNSVDSAFDFFDRAVFHCDADGLGNVTPEHDQQITDIQYQGPVGCFFLRRAIEKSGRPAIPPAGLIADAVLGQTLATDLLHLEIRAGFGNNSDRGGLFQAFRTSRSSLAHFFGWKAASQLLFIGF